MIPKTNPRPFVKGEEVRSTVIDGPLTVHLIFTHDNGDISVRVADSRNCSYMFSGDGVYVRGGPRALFHIDELPFTVEAPKPELKEGDKVLVRNDAGERWTRGHFARFTAGGAICTWTHGTEWASRGEYRVWDEWRLPSEGEL